MDFLYLFRGEKQLRHSPPRIREEENTHTHTHPLRWDGKDPNYLDCK